MKLKKDIPQDSANKSLTNQVVGEIASTVAQKTAETLIANAKSQLNHLFEQKNQFVEMKSSLDGLMQRYNLNNSYLNQAAFWYGNKGWFNKLGTGALFVGASALFGAVIQLSALFTVLALTLHYAVTFVLQNHYETTASQQLMLAEDINKIEERVSVSISAFNKAQVELKQTLKLLSQHNIDMAENVSSLLTQITTLNEQNNQFKEAVAKLERLTHSLVANEGNINAGIQKAGDNTQSISNELTQQALKINEINGKLSDRAKSVRSSTDALMVLNDTNLNSLKQLDELETDASQRVAKLLAKADEALSNSDEYFEQVARETSENNRRQPGFFAPAYIPNSAAQGNVSPAMN